MKNQNKNLTKKEKIEILLVTISVAGLAYFFFFRSEQPPETQSKVGKKLSEIKSSSIIPEKETALKIKQISTASKVYISKREIWRIVEKEFPEIETDVIDVCPPGTSRLDKSDDGFFRCEKEFIAPSKIKIKMSTLYTHNEIGQTHIDEAIGHSILYLNFQDGLLSNLHLSGPTRGMCFLANFDNQDNGVTDFNAYSNIKWREASAEQKQTYALYKKKLENFFNRLCKDYLDQKACLAFEELVKAKCD